MVLWLHTCTASANGLSSKRILVLMKMDEEKMPATEEELQPDLPNTLPDLKTLREARGLTIEDIFLKTRISATILKAIENGEFHVLPAPVYTQKFIQIYAKTVGIDVEILLAQYRRHLVATQGEPEAVRVDKVQIAFERTPSRRYLLYAVPGVAIVAAAFALFFFVHEQKTTGTMQHNQTIAEPKGIVSQPAPTVNERPRETVANAPLTPPPATVVRNETTQTPGTGPLTLLIEATEDTWLSISEDRNPPYQTTLKAGDRLSRTARELFTVDVGNAAGITITFNGKSLGNLGRKGQVVHLRLPQQ